MRKADRKTDRLRLNFGRVIRQHRERLGMAQEPFSIATGLDRTTIGKYERGERQPTLDSILLIARVVHISPGELVDQCWSDIQKHGG